MAFKISLIHGEPVWDSLPVAKITDYPLETRDYKPFAQARLCVSETSIWVRMWSFEVTPSPTSTLKVALNFFPERGGDYFTLAAQYGGKQACTVCTAAGERAMAELSVLPRVKTFASEDLQGIYWGVVFELPRTLLQALYGTNELTKKLVRGNLYKVDEDPCSTHYGCFYRADFTAPNPFVPHYFGDFELVEY